MCNISAGLWPTSLKVERVGAALAQQRPVPVVGYLGNYGIGGVAAPTDEHGRAAVLKGLADTGFVEGPRASAAASISLASAAEL
jgi:hypothetical protein